MVQLPWPNLLTNQFIRPLGPSLGVNRTWTKRNDHAPKSECVDFFIIYVQKGSFEKKGKWSRSITLLLSLVLVFFPPPKKIIYVFFYNNISLPWALAFSTIAPLLPLPSQNPLDHERRPQKMSFGDLELQIYSGVFFLGVTEVVLRRF